MLAAPSVPGQRLEPEQPKAEARAELKDSHLPELMALDYQLDYQLDHQLDYQRVSP